MTNQFHENDHFRRENLHFKIPSYTELATKHVWPLVKENPDLLVYFPDLKDCQLPEKDFMYGVIWILSPDVVRELVAEWVKNRSPVVLDDKGDLVEISEELKDSILNLFTMKSKLFWLLENNNHIATKAMANFLLKKSSVLDSKRNPPKSTRQISQRSWASRREVQIGIKIIQARMQRKRKTWTKDLRKENLYNAFHKNFSQKFFEYFRNIMNFLYYN